MVAPEGLQRQRPPKRRAAVFNLPIYFSEEAAQFRHGKCR
jgi:hypothetical protein